MLQKLVSINKTSWRTQARMLLCTLFLTGLIIIPLSLIDLKWISPVSATLIVNADELIIDENMNHTIVNIERFQDYILESDIWMKENATLFISNINGSVLIKGDIIVERNATISLVKIRGSVSVRADITVEKDSSLFLVGENVREDPPFGFQISGNIVLKENSVFMLNSVPIEFNQKKDYEFGMIANNSEVHLMDAVIVSRRMFNITFYQNSFGTINALRKVVGFRTPTLRFMDSSFGEIGDIELEARSGHIEAYDSSSITLTNSKLISGIKLYQSANILLNMSGSTTNPIPTIQAFDTSNLHIYDSKVELLVSYNFSEVNIMNSLIQVANAFNDSKISMQETEIADALLAYESSNIIMNNSRSELISYFYGNSTAKILGSELSMLSFSDYAKTNTHETKIAILKLRENTVLNASNSEIGSILVEYNSVRTTIRNLTPRYFEHWILRLQSQNITQNDGYAPEIQVENTQIFGIGFRFNGQSDALIDNSEIENLHVTDSSNVQLLGNSTIDSYTIEEPAKIQITGIQIDVINPQGKGLSGTNVTLLLDDTTIEHGITNTDGLVSFTGNYLVDSYTVIAEWNTHSTQESVELLGKPITITLSLPIPWWQNNWYVILIPAVLIVLFLVVLIRRQRKAK